MNLQQIPDNWSSDLLLKRQQGRRMRPELPPPYVTDNGIVMTDRRSHQDRRKSLAAKMLKNSANGGYL